MPGGICNLSQNSSSPSATLDRFLDFFTITSSPVRRPIVYDSLYIGPGEYLKKERDIRVMESKMPTVTDTQAAVAASTGADDASLASSGDMELLGR